MKRARSTAYPVLDLAAAYRILRQDLAALGSAEFDRDEIAKKIGYHDGLGGLAARKVGALVHYNILVRRGSRYGLSPLGLRLQDLDIRDVEFSSTIRAALEQPTLFRMILDRYRGVGRVPGSLASDLAALGITEKASADAEQIFRNSALFAGVLDTEGVFSSKPIASVAAEVVQNENGKIDTEISNTIEIPLILRKGRLGKLILPQPFSAQDYLTLKNAFLSAYELLPEHLDIEVPEKPEDETRGKAKSQESRSPLRFQDKKRQKIGE